MGSILSFFWPLKIVTVKLSKMSDIEMYITVGQYAGATAEPQRRAKEHQRKLKLWGKRTMYYAYTRNMHNSENKLINYHKFPQNKHSTSNIDKTSGYIYIIV